MSTNNRAFRRVDLLFERLIVKQPDALLTGNEVNDTVLQDFKVRRVAFDPESSNQGALAFFTPMPLEALRKYSVCPDLLLPEELSNLDFRDYDPPADAQADDNEYWNTGLCTEMLAEYFKSYILGGFPRRLPPSACSLADMRQLNWISVPHQFLLGAGLHCYYPSSRNFWSAGPILEPESSGDHIYPHTTLVVTQDCEGSNDSMLFGELAAIISSMHNRARQPQVPDEDRESMFDAPYKIAQYDLQFPDEVHFPVIIISFVGPQHGRIFCSYMNGGELIIHQSKLYSFERKESAPFDLFASFALSQPVIVRESVWL